MSKMRACGDTGCTCDNGELPAFYLPAVQSMTLSHRYCEDSVSEIGDCCQQNLAEVLYRPTEFVPFVFGKVQCIYVLTF